MLPKTILVPTDLGDSSDEVIDYALELAATFGAKIHLLNVIGIPTLGVPELGVALTSSVIDGMIRDNQIALEKLADRKRGVVPFGELLLRTGDARDVICQTAKELHADMIVMGTHGRRGVTRALLGSVTESVIRLSPCPVLTVRPHTTGSHDEAAA